MLKINEIWIKDLAEAGAFELLKEMREGYTRIIPLEMLHIEDREICELIDECLQVK
jgi:2-oxoglutarate dehydrogenase complex dehydrogenase (E1) component-like enzyme